MENIKINSLFEKFQACVGFLRSKDSDVCLKKL